MDLVPVNDTRLADVKELEDDEAVRQVVVDVVDEWGHPHTVHPVTIRWGQTSTANQSMLNHDGDKVGGRASVRNRPRQGGQS